MLRISETSFFKPSFKDLYEDGTGAEAVGSGIGADAEI